MDEDKTKEVTPPATTTPPEDTTPTADSKDTGTPPATPPEAPIDEGEPEVTKVDDGTPPATGDEEIDFLDPKAAKAYIEKSVEARLGAVRQDLETQKINNEVKSILAAHPEYKPYEARINKWVNHPNRKSFITKGFPVQSVVLEAIAPYMEKIGAEKARIADEKARKTKSDGAPATATPPKKTDFKAMEAKDIENIAELVKQGRYQ